jgi:cellulose synthase/poly-beta-1,6-N-acetylglucosamine synthase-like glycosyltransferase
MVWLEVVFWAAVALIVYTHVGYPLVLAALGALIGEREQEPSKGQVTWPSVALVIAAYDEAEVIERKVANALALDYPRERLQVVVASDGSADRTAELARAAGADLVLELPRGGKVAALDAAVRATESHLVAFSDANSFWRPDALRALAARLYGRVGYVCGQVRFTGGEGGNQEGLYWRYEMAVRRMESRLAGVTAGNGAIYVVRREAYRELHPARSHDLSFPYELTKRGWRCVYEPSAVAEEKMAPKIEVEFARKRRMMLGVWDVMLRWGMLDPRGYGPVYLFEVLSHRLLRYLTPWLHLIAFGANIALLGEGTIYAVTLAAQAAFLAAAILGRFVPLLPLRIAYYYFAVTASIAVGLWDRLRAGRIPIGWEKVEGTR